MLVEEPQNTTIAQEQGGVSVNSVDMKLSILRGENDEWKG
jgi:hypothetical protein